LRPAVPRRTPAMSVRATHASPCRGRGMPVGLPPTHTTRLSTRDTSSHNASPNDRKFSRRRTSRAPETVAWTVKPVPGHSGPFTLAISNRLRLIWAHRPGLDVVHSCPASTAPVLTSQRRIRRSGRVVRGSRSPVPCHGDSFPRPRGRRSALPGASRGTKWRKE